MAGDFQGAHAADALRRGLGRVGRAAGAWCTLYRPASAGAALAPRNRILRMQAAFGPPGAQWRAPAYGAPAWFGYFDAAYTRAGDYILREESRPGAQDGGIWFIASQDAMLPLLCIRTTRILDIARPGGATAHGVNPYGGPSPATTTPLLTQWPASVTTAGTSGGPSGGTGSLPADAGAGTWTILMPHHTGTTLKNGDTLTDDLGRSALIATTELTHLGWHLTARQTTP